MGGANANEVISALVHGRDDKRALQSQKLFQGGVKASRVQGEVREGDRGGAGWLQNCLSMRDACMSLAVATRGPI